jgi:hypothetical protein
MTAGHLITDRWNVAVRYRSDVRLHPRSHSDGDRLSLPEGKPIKVREEIVVERSNVYEKGVHEGSQPSEIKKETRQAR